MLSYAHVVNKTILSFLPQLQSGDILRAILQVQVVRRFTTGNLAPTSVSLSLSMEGGEVNAVVRRFTTGNVAMDGGYE